MSQMILEFDEFCMFLLNVEVFNIMTQIFLTLLKMKQNAPYYIKNLEILNDRIFRYSRILRRIYTFHIQCIIKVEDLQKCKCFIS